MEKQQQARRAEAAAAAAEAEGSDLKAFVADDGKTYTIDDEKGLVEGVPAPAEGKSQATQMGEKAKEEEEPAKKELTPEEQKAEAELKEKRRLRNEKKKAAKKRKQQQWRQSKVQVSGRHILCA